MGEKEARALSNLVRVGTVSSVDIANRTARVAFADKQDTEGKPLVSGSLKVIQNPPFIPAHDTPQQTQPKGGGSGAAAYEEHTHELIIRPWLPSVGQFVLCIFLPNGESDGFVIGGV